jgi:predicted  nucleic acid-binding Zn-ribbon protein
MKLSTYKKILQDAINNLAERIRQIEWRIKTIETYEQAIEDYKQNPENQDLTVIEKMQLEAEFDQAEKDQSSVEENIHELTDTEGKLGLNNPAVYKPFLANLKNLRRSPEAAKPVSHTEYHINSDYYDEEEEGDDDTTEL